MGLRRNSEMTEGRRDIHYVLPQPVDLNSASYEELLLLRGIGANYAKRIIAQRPYHSLEALVTKARIPNYVLERIRGHIALEQLCRDEHRNMLDEQSIRHRRTKPGRAESGSREAMGQVTMSVRPAKNVLAGEW